MSMDSNWLVVLSMAVLFAVAMFLMRRMSTKPQVPNEFVLLEEKMDRLGKELRYDIMEASRNDRQELSQSLAQFQQTLTEQLALMQANMNSQLLALGEGNTRRMADHSAEYLREETYDLARGRDVGEWMSEVEDARDSLDRLEARLRRLEAGATTANSRRDGA